MDDTVYNWALANPAFSKYAFILKKAEVSHNSMIREDIVEDLMLLSDDNGKLISPIVAKDLVSEYRKTIHEGGIAIYWDIENVPPPLGHKVADTALILRKALAKKYGHVVEFKVYCDTKNSERDESEWVGFNDAGVDVVHACHMRRKEVADKMIIVDAMWFALNHREASSKDSITQAMLINPTICIVSGDSDFSPLLSKFSMNGFHTVSITASSQNVRSVNAQAAEHFTWADFGLTQIPSVPQTQAGIAPREAVQTQQSPGATKTTKPQASPTTEKRNNSVVATTDGEDRHHNLRQSILTAGQKARDRGTNDGVKVLKSQVGAEYSKRNFLGIPFSEAVKAALQDGVVEDGGIGGEAWIALREKNLYLLAAGPAESFENGFYTPICDCVSINVGGQKFHRVAFGPFVSRNDMQKVIQDESFDEGVKLLLVNSPEAVRSYLIDGVWESFTADDLLNVYDETEGLRYIFTNPENNGRSCRYRESCQRGQACAFLHKTPH